MSGGDAGSRSGLRAGIAIAVFLAAATERDRAEPVTFTWSNGRATFSIPVGEHVLWIAPRRPFGSRPAQLMVMFTAEGRTHETAFETATAENGDWAAYATLSPKSPGIYEFVSSDPTTEILVRDNWDPERSVRGRGKTRALIGDHSEVDVP